MQLQLWCDTYDSKNVQALTLISQEQHKVEQELQEAIEQVRQLFGCCTVGVLLVGSSPTHPLRFMLPWLRVNAVSRKGCSGFTNTGRSKADEPAAGVLQHACTLVCLAGGC